MLEPRPSAEGVRDLNAGVRGAANDDLSKPVFTVVKAEADNADADAEAEADPGN